uniref:MAT1-2-4 n=1 Tax=Monilinia fructicola TaxID=38448 RepID=A0A2U8RNR6_MONFR|nr:MAT1-2-4 [Monilinia fructicola]
MQPQERVKASVETSTVRPQTNAVHVLNQMRRFSQDFRRPVSSTTTSQTSSEIGPIGYDAEYTVVHDPPQWKRDGRRLRKPKVTKEQLQSQRELSNIIRRTQNIADSFMKIDSGLTGLRFDIGGPMLVTKQIAAGQRIAMRIYIHNEIKSQAADLKLVKLNACESFQKHMLNFMVDRQRPITQAEGNIFADIIFKSEWKFDPNEEYCEESFMLPYILRSEEIRRELSNLLWSLQFDRNFERIMCHLLPLNYDSWPKETTAARHPRKRRRMRRIERAERAPEEDWVEL